MFSTQCEKDLLKLADTDPSGPVSPLDMDARIGMTRGATRSNENSKKTIG